MLIMNNDYSILKRDLAQIGIREGDSIIIHSSYKSMGGLDGGIKTLIDAILSVLGESGTLIAPTLTFRDVSVENPVFDYVNTPSCVGAVSEYVRTMSGAVRSIHPTHSCAVIGRYTDYFVAGHELDRTPVGKNSPFYKLREAGGKVLMLGCGVGCNTSMHGVEEYFGTPYVLPRTPSPYTIIMPEKTYTIDFYRHHIRQNGFEQRYDRLKDVMSEEFFVRESIHGAESYLIDAKQMWRVGLECLSRDPYFFVEKTSN